MPFHFKFTFFAGDATSQHMTPFPSKEAAMTYAGLPLKYLHDAWVEDANGKKVASKIDIEHHCGAATPPASY